MQTGTERTNEGSDSAPLDQVRTAEGAGAAPTDDSPKPHGDKLGTGAAATVTASELGQPGDSPKRQGDKLEHAVDEAAGR
ncbi:MAG TPA: hypothetical protein VGD16_01465 [Enterovirga sp.]